MADLSTLLVIYATCQPFSTQNRVCGDDPRKQLIVVSLAVARRPCPAKIFFENVPGLASAAYRPILDLVRAELAALGYAVGVLIFKRSQPRGIGNIHATISGLQLVEGRLRQPMLATDLRCRKPSFLPYPPSHDFVEKSQIILEIVLQ